MYVSTISQASSIQGHKKISLTLNSEEGNICSVARKRKSDFSYSDSKEQWVVQ